MSKITRNGESFLDFKKRSKTTDFPTSFCHYIQNFGEIYFWEKGNFHVITKAHHAREILTSDAFSADRSSFFISRMPKLDLSLIPDFFGIVSKMMVMSDDQAHGKRRNLAAHGFEDQVLERFSEKLLWTVKFLLEEIKNKKEVEFVESVAKKLPSLILADLFSIPVEEREQFIKWSNTMTGFFGGASQYRNEDGIEVNQAALSLKHYFTKLIEDRKQTPGEDYVSLLLNSPEIENFSHDEVLSQLIMMLVAGMATTTDQISNIMFQLATHPEIQKEVRENKNLIPSMIEECKRFDPAVTFIFRVVRKETSIGEQTMDIGDVVFISTHAINRDMNSELAPDILNIHRKGTHFAYGYGAHYCIGARLARMEMKALFEELLTGLPPFELDQSKDSIRDHYSLSFSGFQQLNLIIN